MKAKFFLWLGVVSTAGVFLTGCDRSASKKSDESAHIQPGGIAQESEQWGYLGLKIVKAHENQRALDQAPWHADGGDWTFLECEVEKDVVVRVLIGTKMRSSLKKDVPVSWGEAMLAVSDAQAGARFVEVFAKAFHHASQPSHGQAPTLVVKGSTAVLGTQLMRDPRGGFKDAREGSWVATKWFLQDDAGETEVFFNYSIAEKHAEFSEKDEEYREDLVQQLVVGLRDGPLPERTLENDPSLTLVGPKVTGWRMIASSNETCQFSSDSRTLVITAMEEGGKSRLFVAPTAEPNNRKQLAEFGGVVSMHQLLSNADGQTMLMSETLRQKGNSFSSSDPQRLWLVDMQGKRELLVPANLTNWFVAKGCLSPDARYVALGAWETQADKQRARVVHLVDLKTGNWRRVALPGTVLELVSWTGKSPTGVVLTGLGFKKDEARKAYSLDPLTAQLTPLDAAPIEFASSRAHSPDGKYSVEVIGKERCVIIQAATTRQREFLFHPYDRRNVYPDSVQWADNRYLVFQGARTALIDTETLKMSYPASKESGFDGVEFSPDFNSAIGNNAQGRFLGKVEMPSVDTSHQ